MDRKSIPLVVLIVLVILAGQIVPPLIWPPKPAPPAGSNQTGLATPSATGTAPGAVASTNYLGNAAITAPAFNTPEQLAVLENDLVRVTFTSHGGGIKYAELKKYKASVPRRGQMTENSAEFATLNLGATVPALAYAPGPLIGDGNFKLGKEGEAMIAERKNPDGLIIRYVYRLGADYQLSASVRLENSGKAPLALPSEEWMVGTASPMDPHDRPEMQGLYWYNSDRSEHIDASWFGNRSFFSCIVPSSPRQDFSSDATNVVWAAIHNQFFTLIAQPDTPAIGVKSHDFALEKPSESALAADGSLNPNPRAYPTSLILPPVTIPAGSSVERVFQAYAGPKMYRLLKSYESHWDRVMDFTGVTGPCAKSLLLFLNAIHNVIPSYGWCIVVSTLIIRLVFWPLTLISTRSAKRMAALQPQMAAIKEKYKDNPQKQQEKTMQFMRENRINPVAGCLPMLVQTPVFIGFFFMLRTAIELRGQSFLWCQDLSRPDTIFAVPGLSFLPFIGISGVGLPLNLMPLLYISTSLWLSHLQPISPSMDAAQQKMMRYMPLFFCVVFYNYSAGLTLYMTVSNLMNVLQTKLTRTNQDQKPKPTGGAPGGKMKPARA